MFEEAQSTVGAMTYENLLASTMRSQGYLEAPFKAYHSFQGKIFVHGTRKIREVFPKFP